MGLHNKNVDKKVIFSIFCKLLHTYIMKMFTNNEDVVIILKDFDMDLIHSLEKENKPVNLIAEKRKSDVGIYIKDKKSKHTYKK